MTEEEPKPNVGGYALVDWRLSKIEKKLDENVNQYVPIGIYNVNQENIAKELASLHVAISKEVSEREKFEDRIDANAAEIEKGKRSWRLTVAAGVLVAVILAFIQPITHALGLTP